MAQPEDPTESFRIYIEEIPQAGPKTLVSAFALMLLACAKEFAESDRVPLEDRSWEYLIQRLTTRAQHEIDRQSDPATRVHTLRESDLAPGATLGEAMVPVMKHLLRYLEAYGTYYLSKLPPRSIEE